ncbi:L-threonylcarbamoyladenylate synthase [Paractinoplanes hotanensis]|uniref:L-threonylcarbamoyladenylate synthase n=1 Tax=Paractinoplanes hotanensis TaxID=2906497 RepID=A0ABT0YER6_9ACTN|nr:Sua5/YciO/YrdC/YwlC family protein [Actinoplanes hotanensis]MCM4084546.1 Sua5/YciO/YrdC/YwlC family protein [Actinoplanes hotanensis]
MQIVTPNDLALAAHAIEAGGLVVVPTQRWYMLCCDASNPDACARIFTTKRRPPDKSLLFVAPSPEAVRQRFRVSKDAELLAAAFWPGDLALLLPWRDQAEGERHQAVGAPEALVTVAPGILGELATLTAAPIAATSANVSGTEGTAPSITLEEVLNFVASTEADLPIVVDGGVCPIANHLTIVRCTAGDTEVVREGVVHPRAVAAVLGWAGRDQTATG